MMTENAAPMTNPPRLRPDSLGFLLTDTARKLRGAFETRIAESGLGVTPGEARALVHASHAQGERQNALAEKMGVEPMTLCGFVDRLEKRSLVRRAAHPDDRRSKTIELTDAGEDLMREVEQIAARLVDEVTDGLSADENRVLRMSLAHMRDRLADAADARA